MICQQRANSDWMLSSEKRLKSPSKLSFEFSNIFTMKYKGSNWKKITRFTIFSQFFLKKFMKWSNNFNKVILALEVMSLSMIFRSREGLKWGCGLSRMNITTQLQLLRRIINEQKCLSLLRWGLPPLAKSPQKTGCSLTSVTSTSWQGNLVRLLILLKTFCPQWPLLRPQALANTGPLKILGTFKFSPLLGHHLKWLMFEDKLNSY